MSKICSKIIQWWELRRWLEIKQEWSGDTHCSWLVDTRGSLFSSFYFYLHVKFPRKKRKKGEEKGGREAGRQEDSPALRAG